MLHLRWQHNKDDPGGISQEQFNAGQAWTRIVYRHAAIMGYSLTIRTPSFIMVGGGMSCVAEPEEDEIIAVRRKWSDCYNALMSACRDHGLARKLSSLMACAVENWPAGAHVAPRIWGTSGSGSTRSGKWCEASGPGNRRGGLGEGTRCVLKLLIGREPVRRPAMSTPDPSMPDPYQDYDPERARHQGMWFIATLVALVIVSGLIYGAAHRGEKVASNIPAGSIEARTMHQGPRCRAQRAAHRRRG
jgi:hypothetical protein